MGWRRPHGLWPRLPAHEGSGAAESWRRRRGSTMVDHRSWPAMASAATAVYQFIASLPRWALWSVRVPSPEVLASKPARLATSQREEAVPTIRWSRSIGVALLRGRFRRATGQEPANATASGNAACRYGVGNLPGDLLGDRPDDWSVALRLIALVGFRSGVARCGTTRSGQPGVCRNWWRSP